MKYADLSREELNSLLAENKARLEEYASSGLKLDMSRGKPSKEQLDLSNALFTSLSENDYISADGTDCRNYGGLDGLIEMKQIFSDILNVKPEEIIVGGNSSLTMMYDNIAGNMINGVDGKNPWISQGKIKFICPVPGYDRHFAICEGLNIEMIPVSVDENGPDMDTLTKLVSNDPMIKGIWCVPRYSNPEGIVYSDETVRRLAALKPAAADFRIYWDNAYAIHHLTDNYRPMPNILEECKLAGNPDMVYIFFSFSKISFGGASVVCVASSGENIRYIKNRISKQMIGPDKINQLRHVRFFKDAPGVYSHMKKHAEILKPKFDLTIDKLRTNLGGLDVAKWSKPDGGYFISFYGINGTAKRIVSLCGSAGLVVTPAGAAFPYGVDKNDSHIRIAPSYPTLSELSKALDIFCIAVKTASIEALLK